MTQDHETQGEPTIIGWREKIDLPEWGLKRVRAKTDTGARTSAIDVADIEELEDDEIRFRVVYHHDPEKITRWIHARTVRKSTVKPSHGEPQQRYVCETLVRIGKVQRRIEISLVSRKGMLCRMLLGRTALDGLLVDASRMYVLTDSKRKPRVIDPVLEHPSEGAEA
ncbi:MAG: ATP-dependent zinc protease [Phycisphaerales bacterium]|nr:ATP-dependent zinc protease [Phycisphaerales bacterium]